MPLPYYVSPEQMMKDKAEYARKGISRGRSIVTLECADGILLVAENPSSLLHKISEIYDRIAFAAVGMYNEFENLRKAGVRYADFNGYLYDRNDVTALGLANAYAQTLGTIFTESRRRAVLLGYTLQFATGIGFSAIYAAVFVAIGHAAAPLGLSHPGHPLVEALQTAQDYLGAGRLRALRPLLRPLRAQGLADGNDRP